MHIFRNNSKRTSASERWHRRPPPVLTREELEAEKQELAAIDARPIKKIAEAKARKKRRLAVSTPAALQPS